MEEINKKNQKQKREEDYAEKKIVSVIIPMFNSEKTISKAINSILKQTYSELEIIVVDDGSTDKSYKIVNKLAEKYKIKLIKQENAGPSSARNLGIKNSSGEFIAFLDSDDFWKKDKILKQIEVFLKNKDIGIVATRVEEKKYKTTFEKLTIRKILFSLKGFHINTPTVVIRREVINKIGYFDEKVKYCEDAEYWFRILNKYSGVMINENLVICGSGKRMFGESGLSGDLKKMHEGVKENYLKLFKNMTINKLEYTYLIVIEKLKYLRRRIISWNKGGKCI